MGFRENLKAELSYSGLLVKELAERTGLKKYSIDNYLSVRGRMPSAEAAVRIARALGVSAEYLVSGEEAAPQAALSPEARRLARTAELLSPANRKIALALVETLRQLDGAEES